MVHVKLRYSKSFSTVKTHERSVFSPFLNKRGRICSSFCPSHPSLPSNVHGPCRRPISVRVIFCPVLVCPSAHFWVSLGINARLNKKSITVFGIVLTMVLGHIQSFMFFVSDRIFLCVFSPSSSVLVVLLTIGFLNPNRIGQSVF